MRKYFAIALVVALLISAGAYIIRKATEKENTQNTTIQVAAGGIANVTTTQSTLEDKKKGLGVYVERSTEGKGITFGVKYEF